MKKHQTVSDNPPIRIYLNKIETPKSMKLLGNTKSNVSKDENRENEAHKSLK